MRQLLVSHALPRIAVGLAVAAALAGSHLAASSGAASPSAATPPASVTATPIARTPNTRRPGTLVRQSQLGHRVFVDAQHGFALASLTQAQYPAATQDGGRTWRIDGPALHVNAAQAPLVVLDVGAASKRTFFAFGGPGGGQAVDVTSDGGKHWWRAILGEVVLAVVAAEDGKLFAVAQGASGSSGAAVNWVYVSSDGGRHWRYDNRLGAI